jgi:hypothetical protein
VIGWNGGHTAVTLPDGTPVSSGERGGVHIGGAGAYQRGFTHHMFLPMDDVEGMPPVDEPPAPVLVDVTMPAPAPDEAPPPDSPPALDAAMAPPAGKPAPMGDPDVANT